MVASLFSSYVVGTPQPASPVFLFSSPSMPSGATLTRSSSGSRINNSGGMVLEGVDVPRFDYDPISLAFLGLLIEPSRRNLINNTTITTSNSQGSAIADPLGNSTGLRFVSNGTTNDPLINSSGAGSLGTIASRTFGKSASMRMVDPQGMSPQALLFDYGSTSVEFANSSLFVPISTVNYQRFGSSRSYPSNAVSTSVLVRADPFDGSGGTNSPVANGTMDVALFQYEEIFSGERQATSTYIPPQTTRSADVLVLNWASRGIADGTYDIKYTFSDGTTQTVNTAISGGTTTVPTNLSKPTITRIEKL